MAKADRNLFQKLLVAKDAGREIDLARLLEHELSSVPMSLCNTLGDLRKTDKSSLGKVLQNEVTQSSLPTSARSTCTLIDGQALVQAIGATAACKTFGDFADKFASAVFSYIHDKSASTRVDVIFDRYLRLSIKSDTRKKRAGGAQQAVHRMVNSRDVPMVRNWKQYMSLGENKSDLANFLSEQLKLKAETKGVEIVIAGGFSEGKTVYSSTGRKVEHLQSTQEEADTRLILHGVDACQQGFERLVYVCRDTDVLVLLVHFLPKLSNEVWMRTGTRKQYRYVAVHDINVPSNVSRNIPAFHALTGCDTTSSFYGIGKRRAWKAFLCHPELLKHLGVGDISTNSISRAEEFVCRLYLPSTLLADVNEARIKLFQRGVKDLETLPPTKDALKQHILRAHYQALIWHKADEAAPELPPATSLGRRLIDNSLRPVLSTKEHVPPDYKPLLFCKCTNCSSTRCKCRKNGLKCTGTCACVDNMCRNPCNADS